MKTIKAIQMESFEGSSLRELQDRFNTVMRWASKYKYIDHVIDLSHLQGYVTYEVFEQIPECIKDQLEIEGLFPKCGECKEYCKTSVHRGECRFCRGSLRSDDHVCSKVWDAWEDGDCWLIEGERYGDVQARLNCKTLKKEVRETS